MMTPLNSQQKKKIGEWVIQTSDSIKINFRFHHNYYPCSSLTKQSETFIIETMDIKKFHQANEMMILLKIQHQNLLKVHDVRTSSNNAYIIYEPFVDDYETLANFIKKNGNLSIEKILQIVLEIIAGLQELNKNLLIHRSICPNTVIFYREHWKIAGYETVKYVENLQQSIKFSNSFIPDETDQLYLPPEFLEKSYGNNCDVYSIGVLMLEMLVGSNKIQKNKGKFNVKDVGLEPEMSEILQGLLNENFRNRTDLKNLKKKLENYQTNIEEVKVKVSSLGKTVSKSMGPIEYGSNLKMKHSNLYEIKIDESIRINEDPEINSPKCLNLEFLNYLMILAEFLQRKITEIDKIKEDLMMKNKNILIYQMVYLLVRLEYALRKKIITLSKKNKDKQFSENYKKDFAVSKDKVQGLNEMFKAKKAFFKNEILVDFIENESDELFREDLNKISEFLEDLIKDAFEKKEGYKKTINVLKFLSDLAWILKEKRLKEEVFSKKEMKEERMKKYAGKIEELKERHEGKQKFNEHELKEQIAQFLR